MAASGRRGYDPDALETPVGRRVDSIMDTPDLQSAEAWSRMIEGLDQAALLVVIEHRLGDALRRSCAPEDILQETLLQAWRSRAQFEWRGPRSFRAWVLRIIDHRIRDEHDRLTTAKREGRFAEVSITTTRNAALSTSYDVDLPAGSTTPSRLASLREQAELYQRTLGELPEEVREVVRLRRFEQLELEEIAHRMGLGLSAVRHRFRKGDEIYARRLKAAFATRSDTETPDSATPPRADPAA